MVLQVCAICVQTESIQLLKKGGAKLKTYYTKCGKTFEKSSTADVTGYTIDKNDKECANCPFQVEVTEGYPPVHKRWECRAGSQKPNKNNEWVGSVEDKNTIRINSLDNNFLEFIIEYCEEHPDLSAGYNQDLADCRRTISISCSQNKKGIAAKKAIIEKFFTIKADPEVKEPAEKEWTPKCPYLSSIGQKCVNCSLHFKLIDKREFANEADSKKYYDEICFKDFDKCETYQKIYFEQMNDDNEDCNCQDCCNSSWYTGLKQHDGQTHTFCQVKKEEIERPGIACEWFNRKKHIENCINCISCQPSEKGEDHPFQYKCYNAFHRVGYDWYFDKSAIACENFEKKGENEVNCKIISCSFNNGEGGCGFEEDDANNDLFETLAEEALKLNCKNKELKTALENIQKEQKVSKPIEYTLIDVKDRCPKEKEDCSYFCKHNGGCALLLMKGHALESVVESHGEVDCHVYRMKVEPYDKQKEIATIETAIDAPVSNSLQEFDYSSVDNDTASFLQDKANKINEIRIKSVIAIGKEFKEAQEKLSNNKSGTFQVWVKSLGFDPKTAYNYINGFNYIMENFHNIEDAENIQPSLLFAVSKPSAPAELQKAVMEGDITTHKQYKDLEAKLKAEQEAARSASQAIEAAVGRMNEAEKEAQKLEAEKRSIYEAYQKDVKTLREQLEEAKQNSDPEKVKELEKSIETYQQQLDDMSEMLEEKDRQLNEQPIEVKATKVEEVIPEELKQAVVDNVVSNINKFLNISAQEYKIFIAAGRADTDKYLDIIDDFMFFISGIRKEINQKG